MLLRLGCTKQGWLGGENGLEITSFQEFQVFHQSLQTNSRFEKSTWISQRGNKLYLFIWQLIQIKYHMFQNIAMGGGASCYVVVIGELINQLATVSLEAIINNASYADNTNCRIPIELNRVLGESSNIYYGTSKIRQVVNQSEFIGSFLKKLYQIKAGSCLGTTILQLCIPQLLGRIYKNLIQNQSWKRQFSLLS